MSVLDPARRDDFAPTVITWHQHRGRHDLPWQRSRDPYRIWLSEIMLQQTQVATVIPYFERFVTQFPSVTELAAAPLERVLELWSGLGYYSRARNLHAAACLIASRFQGVFPSEVSALETLPGVGRSTAGAIAAFGFGVSAPILDANVKRVLARWVALDGPLEASANQTKLWEIASELVPRAGVQAYTQGLMDLGALVCRARDPDCPICPLNRGCAAYAQGLTAQIPAAKSTRPKARRRATLLVLHHHGSILLRRRVGPGVWEGLWSLPQWDAPDARDEAIACARHYGKPDTILRWRSLEHEFTHYRLEADIYAIDLAGRIHEERGAKVAELWIDLAQAQGAALPAPIKRLLIGLYRASPMHRGDAQVHLNP